MSLGGDRPVGTKGRLASFTRGTTDSIRRFLLLCWYSSAHRATYEYHYRMFYGIAV